MDAVSKKIKKSVDAYTHPQIHACFIQSVQDDLVQEGGIMDLWTREARIFKYGSGTGSNFSQIRGGKEPLSGGGVSSGLLSFLKIGDVAAGAIKSGGTTRRAAKMVCLDVDHPDIEDFIQWKVREEQKVAALVTGSKIIKTILNELFAACHQWKVAEEKFDRKKNQQLRKVIQKARTAHVPFNYVERIIQLAKQGYTGVDFDEYDTDWNSEAYHTISGQNANNSIRLPNEFMEAVAKEEDWHLYWRTEQRKAKAENRAPRPCQTLKASELWEQIAYAAWAAADPGLQFDTTINEWHTCPADGPIRASNPCVTADTLIATHKGLEPIGNLVGETRFVTGLDGQLHEVSQIFSTGVKPVYELCTQSGYRLKLTGNHRVFTKNRGDVQACELTKDDVVRLVPGTFGSFSCGNIEMAQSLGLLLGNKCITNLNEAETDTSGQTHRAVHLTLNKEEKSIVSWANDLINSVVSKFEEHDKPSQVLETSTTYQTSIRNPRLLEQLEKFVILDQSNSGKKLTSFTFQLNKNEQAALLPRTLYHRGNGCQLRSKISICSFGFHLQRTLTTSSVIVIKFWHQSENL